MLFSQLLLLCWYLKVIKLKSVLFITIPINSKRQEDGRGNSWISERLKRTVQRKRKKKKAQKGPIRTKDSPTTVTNSRND